MVDDVGGSRRTTAEDSNRTWLRVKMSMKTHKIKGKNGLMNTMFNKVLNGIYIGGELELLKPILRYFDRVNVRWCQWDGNKLSLLPSLSYTTLANVSLLASP